MSMRRSLMIAAVAAPLIIGAPAIALAGSKDHPSHHKGGTPGCSVQSTGGVEQDQVVSNVTNGLLGPTALDATQRATSAVEQELSQDQSNTTDQTNETDQSVVQVNPVVVAPQLPGAPSSSVEQDNSVRNDVQQDNANRTEQDQRACQAGAS